MLDMRFRIPELFVERGETAWTVANRSNGRITYNTLYRVAKKRGRLKLFDAALMEALCDVLEVTPGELFERDKRRKAG